MDNQPKKILICEDHQIVIDGLLSVFKNQPDYEVKGYITGQTVIFHKIFIRTAV